MSFLVYTDGSASVKDRTGGYAWKIVDGNEEVVGGGSEVDTTISRMELMAVISALREINIWTLCGDGPNGEVALVISDSEYVVKGFMDKTRARNKNVDLWDWLEKEASHFDLVHLQHTKGHAADADNCEVDKLAGEFRQAAVDRLNTRVVHCQKKPYDVYIGRRNSRYGLAESKWRNPFKIGKDGTRAEVIELYEKYVLNKPELRESLGELKGKVLGCWCAPEACHGDVLVRLSDAT